MTDNEEQQEDEIPKDQNMKAESQKNYYSYANDCRRANNNDIIFWGTNK